MKKGGGRAPMLPLPSRPYNRKDDNPVRVPRSEVLTARENKMTRKSAMKGKTGSKLIFDSPRLQIDDDALFPEKNVQTDPNRRWSVIAKQAEGHGQDGTTYTIKRGLSAMALKKGMVPSIASRVRTLTLWLDNGEDNLPVWLDTIAGLFLNIENLVFLQQVSSDDVDAISVSARMRRLYVLYRLPHLRSIDNVTVTKEERQLACPANGNGNESNRKTTIGVIQGGMGSFTNDDHRNIFTAESIGNHTATELKADLEDLTERLAVIMDAKSDEDNAGKSRSIQTTRSRDIVPVVSASSEDNEQVITSQKEPARRGLMSNAPSSPTNPLSLICQQGSKEGIEIVPKPHARKKWSVSCGTFNICGTRNVAHQICANDSFSVDIESFKKRQERLGIPMHGMTPRTSVGRPPLFISTEKGAANDLSAPSSEGLETPSVVGAVVGDYEMESADIQAWNRDSSLSRNTELPPSGPANVNRRKVVASSLLQNPVRKKLAVNRFDKYRRNLHLSVRGTSVLDVDEEDDEELRINSKDACLDETVHFAGHVPGEW